MPINPQIPLQAQAPAMMTPDKLLTLKMLTQQNQLGQLQVEDALKARESNDQLRQVFSQPGATDPSGTLSLEAINKAYTIDPKAAQGFATSRNKSLKEVAELSKLRTEDRVAKSKYLRDGLASVRDQPSYDVWRMEAIELGLPRGLTLPPAFDPQWQRQNVMDADKFIAQNTPKADDGKWSAPYKLDGSWVQKNERTGQVRQAVSGPMVTVDARERDKRFDQEDKLRNDYTANPTVKAASEMNSAFRLIEAAYQKPSAANDLAMATKYMKVLDPTSVVRESEFALAVNATGLLDKVLNYANAITKGQKLNPAQRKDFYDSAKAINDTFQNGRQEIDDQYSEMAKGYGLEPKNVVTSLRRKKPDAVPEQPKPGTAKPSLKEILGL